MSRHATSGSARVTTAPCSRTSAVDPDRGPKEATESARPRDGAGDPPGGRSPRATGECSRRRAGGRYLRLVPSGTPAPDALLPRPDGPGPAHPSPPPTDDGPVLRPLPQPLPGAWTPLVRVEPEPGRGGPARLVVVGGTQPDLLAPAEGAPALLPGARADTEDDTSGEPPDALAQRLVQALMDVVAGHRPATQVLRWSSAEVFDSLRQRARVEQAHARRVGARRRPVVKQVRVQEQRTSTDEAAVEVAAVVIDGPRVRAVAARLEGRPGRWRLTALTIG